MSKLGIVEMRDFSIIMVLIACDSAVSLLTLFMLVPKVIGANHMKITLCGWAILLTVSFCSGISLSSDMPTTSKAHESPLSITNSVGMRFNLIRPGSFLMGSPNVERGRSACELLHEVEISNPFYMGVFEVTQGVYEEVMGQNPSLFSAQKFGAKLNGINTSCLPVERVSWKDALEFCAKLSGRVEEKNAARKYRLPSEAEWEYASRGASNLSAPFCLGGKPAFTLSLLEASFNANYPYGVPPQGDQKPHPVVVGSYDSNSFGLFDMHGNVAEWCSDWYAEDYYKHCPRKDPLGPSDGILRVVRGGSFVDSAIYCRSAARDNSPPLTWQVNIGFRVVCINK